MDSKRPLSPGSLSEAACEVVVKKWRAASSSSSPPPRKVCIVCTSAYEECNNEYNIFIVDLNSGGSDDDSVNVLDFTAMDPTLRLDRDCLYDAAFCVVGWTLYAFEGYHEKYNPKGGKSMFTYELPSDNLCNLKLERSMLLEAVSSLNHIKVSPTATATPYGKILVFSSVIDTLPPNECDFEIYDPADGIWRKLPRLRPSVDRGLDYFWIFSFTFVEKSVLLLRTEVGVFTLDLKPPHNRKRWKPYGFRGAPSIPSHPGTSFVVIGKDICLIPFSAYDIDERGIEEKENVFSRWFYSFPELSSFPDSYSFESGGITLLDDYDVNTRDCNLCLLHAGVNDETMHPELILDVYSCDLTECRKGLTEYRRRKIEEDQVWWKRKREKFLLPGTTKVKSFKISVKAQQSHWFHLRSFSSIPV